MPSPAGRSAPSCRRRECRRSRSSPPSPSGSRGRRRGRARPRRVCCRRDAGTAGTPAPGRRCGTPGPRSTTRISTRSSNLRRLDPDPCAIGAERDRVVDDVGDRPLEQRRIGAHFGQATRARRRRRSPPRDRGSNTAARTTSSGGVGTIDGWITPACTLLMSSRLPTRAVSRSVSVSIVLTNSAVSCVGPGDVAVASGSWRTP